MEAKKNKLSECVRSGRRKTASASVRLRKGSGRVKVNGREIEAYFPLELQRKEILAPLAKLADVSQYDLIIRVKGGGIEAQATAARLALARALVTEEETRRADLKAEGFLTRDSRKKERKKYGRAGARKSFQFSKR